MRYYKLCLAILLITFFSFTKTSSATNWYIDSEISTSGSGTTWSNAWKTFPDIVWTKINPGDSLFISGGNANKSYTGALNIEASGNSSNPISIRIGQDLGHSGVATISSIRTNNNSWITIDGEFKGSKHLKISGNSIGIYTGTGVDVGIKLTYLIISNNGIASGHHGIQFRGYTAFSEVSYCDIYNNYQDGINVYNGGNTGSFDSLRVHHNTIFNNGDDGIQTGREISIYNNTIYGHNQWDRGHPDNIQQSGGASHTKIYNNIIYGAGNWNIAVDPNSNSSNIWIYNNLVYGDSAYEPLADTKGILIYADKDGIDISSVKVLNNTVVDCRLNYGIGFYSRNTTGISDLNDVIIMNNLVYSSAGIISEPDWGSITNYSIDYNVLFDDGVGNATDRISWNRVSYICTNGSYTGLNENGSCNKPVFVDMIRRNYKLSDTDKVAYGMGTDLSEFFTEDIEGTPRTVWSIGAYESSLPSDSDTISPASPSNLLLN